MGHAKDTITSLGFANLWEFLGSLKRKPKLAPHEQLLKEARAAQSYVGHCITESPGGASGVCQVNTDLDLAAISVFMLCGESAQHWNNGACWHFIPLQPLPWSPTIQFLLIYPWHLLGCYLFAGQSVCEWMSLCADPLRRCLFFQQPSISSGWNSYWFSWPGIVGTAVPSTGVLGWGSQCGAGTPCFSGETSTAEISLLILNHHR